jgi:hypothetical protein
MAALITLVTVTILVGALAGAFFKISFAIRQEDRIRGSLRYDAPSTSTRAARDLTGISGSRWD